MKADALDWGSMPPEKQSELINHIEQARNLCMKYSISPDVLVAGLPVFGRAARYADNVFYNKGVREGYKQILADIRKKLDR